MAETADIVVIGGGIIGSSVAYQLAKLLDISTRIVVCDRGPIAGATSASCMGHLMVTPDTAQDYALTKTSVDMWGDLAEELGGFDYNPTGALYLAETDEDLEVMPALKQPLADDGDRADVLDLREGQGLVVPLLAVQAGRAHRSRPLPVACFGEWALLDNVYFPTLQRATRAFLGFPLPFWPYGLFGLPLPRKPPRGEWTRRTRSPRGSRGWLARRRATSGTP